MFRALLAHPQEALHKLHFVYFCLGAFLKPIFRGNFGSGSGLLGMGSGPGR
jgi:hypothetical protein